MITAFIMLGTNLLMVVSFYFGYKFGKEVRTQTVEASDEERKRVEKLRKGFQRLMNYDVSTATRRRRVDV